MPIVSKGYLRRQLGLTRLGDTTVGTQFNGVFCFTSVASFDIGDAFIFSDVTRSGENLYARADLRAIFTGNQVNDFKIASFNTGSGSFVIYKAPRYQHASAANRTPFEVHTLVPPADKDRAIDQVITDLWERREIPLDGVDSVTFYSIGPDVKVFNAWYYSDPTDSLSRGQGNFSWWGIGRTGSGRELRVTPAVQASYQVILDAQVGLTLGDEVATCNVPSEEWVLDGAAAICYDLLAARAPSQEAATFRERSRFYKRRWLAGQALYAEPDSESPRLDEVW